MTEWHIHLIIFNYRWPASRKLLDEAPCRGLSGYHGTRRLAAPWACIWLIFHRSTSANFAYTTTGSAWTQQIAMNAWCRNSPWALYCCFTAALLLLYYRWEQACDAATTPLCSSLSFFILSLTLDILCIHACPSSPYIWPRSCGMSFHQRATNKKEKINKKV